MSNLFRGAMNLLGGAEGDGNGEPERYPPGKRIEIGGSTYRVRRKIAGGGFAMVYSCVDGSGAWSALKVQLCNEEGPAYAVQQEINMLKQLNHRNIMKIHKSAVLKLPNRTTEFLILTELCSGGSVKDMIDAGPLTLAQVANIFHATCSALECLHSQRPPITHRDIKVENLLIDNRGYTKLCDFGSATTEQFAPDDQWTSSQRTQLEENFQRHTTPMYRAPEILETYNHFPVGPLQDIWAAGCVLYYLCFLSHPFPDSAKLRIVYAKYSIPNDSDKYSAFLPLIQRSLTPDPRERPSAAELAEDTAALSVALGVRVDVPVPGVDTSLLTGGEQMAPTKSSGPSPVGGAPSLPGGVPPRQQTREGGELGQQASAALSSIKGQGISLFKNFKEKTSAVVQSVQNTYGSKGPEMVWVTSRVLMAPQASNVMETLAAQEEESLRVALFATRRPFKIINLAQRRLRGEYPVAVADHIFPSQEGPSPSVDILLSTCQAAAQYLRGCPSTAFVVLVGSEVHCTLAAISLLVYHRLFPKPWCAVELLQEKRPSPLLLPPSAHAAIDIIHTSTQPDFGSRLRSTEARLEGVSLRGLPTFNHARTGCRPFAMVFVGGIAMGSPESYDSLKSFEGSVRASLPLHKMLVAGHVCVVLYHARANSLSGKVTRIPMLSFSFHTSLVESSSLRLARGDLDFAPEDESLIPLDIKVELSLAVSPSPRGPPKSLLFDYPSDVVAPRHVVESTRELDDIQAKFARGTSSGQRTEAPVPGNGFFETLSWDQAPSARAAGSSVAPQEEGRKREEREREAFVPMETPILGGTSHSPSVTHEEQDVDLLGLSSATPRVIAAPSSGVLFDPFSPTDTSSSSSRPPVSSSFEDFFSAPSAPQQKASCHADIDLLGGSPVAPQPPPRDILVDMFDSHHIGSMQRNASEPSFPQPGKMEKTPLDPFAEFLAANPSPAPPPGSASSTRSSTPKPTANYSRTAFEGINNTGINKPKVTAATFDDLLSGAGLSGMGGGGGNRSMADMRRAEDIRDMTPEQIKIRDWTAGKERNIRALLASLNDVLWEGADKWNQPSMASLLTAAEVKKNFRRAAVVVHPDKQTGTAHAELAKAIMIELNDAWNAFESAGGPSL